MTLRLARYEHCLAMEVEDKFPSNYPPPRHGREEKKNPRKGGDKQQQPDHLENV